MRAPIVSVAITMLVMLIVSAPSEAQFFGPRSYDVMGDDRPPGPVPNAKQGQRRVYKPLVGNYPPCKGLMWSGTRCRLPTGQVCTVYEHGLDNCV